MSRKFLTPVGLPAGSSLPAAGSAGDLFFKTDESKIYVHNGTTWIVSQVDLEATNVSVDTTNFDGNLSSSDTTVQAALETLDELSSGGSFTAGTGIVIESGEISVDTTVIAELNSPTFTGLTDFTGIVDFSEAVVLGIDALPSQTGEVGNYLTTDGTNASWAPIPAQSPHPFAMIG